MTNPSALCRFSRSPSTEAPTLHRRYPASLVLRASPPPHTAQPDSHELPVDAFAITAGASRVASGPPCLHAVANTPAGPMKPVRSYCSIGVDLPRPKGGSAPASPVSRPAQRSLALRPACSPSRLCDPLHRRLQRLRYLYHCFGCYRAERTSSREGLPPSVDQRLFTAHLRIKAKNAYLNRSDSVIRIQVPIENDKLTVGETGFLFKAALSVAKS